MPRALPVDLRQTIVEGHQAGASLAAVAAECALSPERCTRSGGAFATAERRV